MAATQQPSGSIPLITTTAPPTASDPAPALAETAPALPQGTFSSILPAVEDVLQLIYGLAEGDVAATTDAIVAKAKEVNTQLANMKKAANELPGGHLGVDGVVAVTKLLEEQIERKHLVRRLQQLTDKRRPESLWRDADADRRRSASGGNDRKC